MTARANAAQGRSQGAGRAINNSRWRRLDTGGSYSVMVTFVIVIGSAGTSP